MHGRISVQSYEPASTSISRGSPLSGPVLAGLVRLADALCILAAGVLPALSVALRGEIDWRVASLAILLGLVLSANMLHFLDAYRFETLGLLNTTLSQVFIGWMLTVGIVVLAIYASQASDPATQSWLQLWVISGALLLAGNRILLWVLMRRWEASGGLRQKVVILGTGQIGQRVLRHAAGNPDPRMEIVGVYDDRLDRIPARCMGHPVLGTLDDLVRDLRHRRIDLVIVAIPLSAEWRLAEILNKLSLIPVDVRLSLDQFGPQLGACSVSHLGGLTYLDALNKPLRDWWRIAKGLEDRLLASLILLLIAPVLAAITIAIKLDSPGPIFFRQKRYGFNNQLIEVLKFRTMYDHAQDQNAEQLTQRNDPRVTRIGAFLRRTSLDELPQFINVLRGEMSIVGPRPHALAAKAGGLLYQDAIRWYDARHRVKPGITGWAQVNGWRGETETTEQIARRVEHDLYYIENWSLALDFKIILRTVLGGFTGRSAY